MKLRQSLALVPAAILSAVAGMITTGFAITAIIAFFYLAMIVSLLFNEKQQDTIAAAFKNISLYIAIIVLWTLTPMLMIYEKNNAHRIIEHQKPLTHSMQHLCELAFYIKMGNTLF